MKNLKRIISGILCVVMLCAAMPIIAAEAEEQATVYGTGTPLGLLNALGITEYEEDALSADLTRADFYALAAVAGGYGEASLTAGRFSDVDSNTANAEYIEALVNAGIISANAMGKIFPDGGITLSEASAVMVKILGYSLKAEDKGGYPAGYKKVALDLELYDGLDGVGDQTVLNTGMAVQLVYNALNSTVMSNKTYTSKYVMTEGGSLMYSVFGVRHINDVLKAVDISRITGENDVDAFHIEIGETQLESRAVENVYSYLGYDVDVFYKERTNQLYDKIIYMAKTKDNQETEIDIEDIVSVDGGAVQYTDDESNKTRKASYVNGIPVIYNGVSTGQSFTKALINGKLGKIRLLDNDGCGSADVVFVDAYVNYVASYADGKDYVMYNMYDTTDTIKLDTEADDPYTIIYKSNGEEGTISNIKKDMVVSVYQSASDAYQQYIRAYVNGNVVEGIVSVVKDNNKYVTVGETEYRVNAECMKRDKKFITPGSNVKLYLDVAGRVARITQGSSTSMQYAYIMGARFDGSFEKEVYLKLFTIDGEFIEETCTSKFMLDGVRVKNTDNAVLTRLHEACKKQFGTSVADDAYSSVVRIMKNEKGLISAIDTLVNGETTQTAVREDKTESSDAMFSITYSASQYYNQNYRKIGTQIAVDLDKTKVMVYPSPSENLMDEESYRIYNVKEGLKHNGLYKPTAFYTDRNSVVSEVVGIPQSEYSGTLSADDKFAVVDYTSKGLDADGQVIDVLTVIGAGGRVDIPIKDGYTITLTKNPNTGVAESCTIKPSDLITGDVVRYATDVDGYLSTLTFYYRAEKKVNLEAFTAVGTYWNEFTLHHAYVYDSYEDGYLMYLGDGALKDITSADCELVCETGASPVYYKFGHRDNGEAYVEAATASSLKSYMDTGDACSEIIIQRRHGSPQAGLIMEKTEGVE